MKFKVGDKIRVKAKYPYSLFKHKNAIGMVLELRRYARRWTGGNYTHYLVKFDCYKIPHVYTIWKVDEYCELI